MKDEAKRACPAEKVSKTACLVIGALSLYWIVVEPDGGDI